MPLLIALHGRVEEFLDLGERDDLVELAFDLPAAHAEDRAVEENVLAAGQLRVKAGADFQQARDPALEMSTRPSVGSVMRLRILSSVLLPAPLRPMMPTTSPLLDLEGDVFEGPEFLDQWRLFGARGGVRAPPK